MSCAARQSRPDLAAQAARRAWLAHAAAVLLLAVAPFLAGPASAADRIAVQSAQLMLADDGDGGLMLDAQFDFELPPVLEDAVNRGIALYFVVEFELFRPRWYWFDKKLIDETRTFR